MRRTLAVRAIVAVSVTAFAGAAHADLCSNLQQQYIAVGNGGAGVSITTSASNVAALNRSLSVAQGSAEENHCTGSSSFGQRPAPFCPLIMAEVSRLQSAIRDSYRSGQVVTLAQSGPSRDQVRSALVANGCPVPGSRGQESKPQWSDQDSAGQYGSGGYRTLCVRTCDGYYFPLAYGASSDRFKTDTQTCQTMYGGANNAQLFVMPSDGDVADATPVNGGKSYGKQPYAFAYRSAYNPSCASQLQSGVTTPASTATTSSAKSTTPATGTSSTDGALPATTARGPIIPIPRTRPTKAMQFEDPETVADAVGALKPTQTQPLVAVNNLSRGIRVVGADYFNQILDQQNGLRPPTLRP